MRFPNWRGVAVLICAQLLLPQIGLASDLTPAVLTIQVENVSAKGGDLQIALYDKSTYDGHDQPPMVKAVVKATFPVTVVTLPDLRPGIYALELFQDLRRTGVFAVDAIGLPEEPFGFSNDARPLLDQPSFDATKFVLTSGAHAVVVHLRSIL